MSGSSEESHLVILRMRPMKDALRIDTWNRRKKKIVEVADRVISEALCSEDAYTIHGDETCMIALAKATKAEAETKAGEISDRIVRSLFGDFGASTFPLEYTVLAIRDLMKNVGCGETGDLLQHVLDSQRDALSAATPIDGRQDARKLEKKAARRRKVFELFEQEGPAEIGYEYRPVWRADHQMVDCFRYVPILQRSVGERLEGYGVLGPNYTESDLVELDIEAIESGVIDLKQAVDAGRDVRLSLRVHFETVGSSNGRTELTKLLSVLPQSFRQRITFTLEGIPDGIPETRLHGVVHLLKPYSDDTLVCLDMNPPKGRVIRSLLARVRAVGMDTVGIKIPLDATQADLDFQCAVIRQIANMGLKTKVFGLASGEDVARFVAAGCDALSGPIFGGPFAKLPEPYPISIGRLSKPARMVSASSVNRS